MAPHTFRIEVFIPTVRFQGQESSRALKSNTVGLRAKFLEFHHSVDLVLQACTELLIRSQVGPGTGCTDFLRKAGSLWVGFPDTRPQGAFTADRRPGSRKARGSTGKERVVPTLPCIQEQVEFLLQHLHARVPGTSETAVARGPPSQGDLRQWDHRLSWSWGPCAVGIQSQPGLWFSEATYGKTVRAEVLVFMTTADTMTDLS